jgi:hypothetical protein
VHVLFEDLSMQEAVEEGRLSRPMQRKYAARICLVELYGYPREVRSNNKPYVRSVSNFEQARFIDEIALFPTAKIDQAVRKVFHSTDDDNLARACARYLAGRGADEDIRKYVRKRLKNSSGERRKALLCLKERIGWTALHAAAEMGLEGKMEELIRRGADVNARAANGQTALHVATREHQDGVVSLLLKDKANPNIRDRHGLTPLQYAARSNSKGIVKSLRAHGAIED